MTDDIKDICLTNEQCNFLNTLLELQRERIFNNAYKYGIESILQTGYYSKRDKRIMGNIIVAYKDWKKTGIVPQYYSFETK